MRGKKPKEREKYIIRLGDGTLVEVGREIYLEWHRSGRRERYQKERDKKYGMCSLEGLEGKDPFPGKTAEGDAFLALGFKYYPFQIHQAIDNSLLSFETELNNLLLYVELIICRKLKAGLY